MNSETVFQSDADFWYDQSEKINLEITWHGFTEVKIALPIGYEHSDVEDMYINEWFQLHIKTTDGKTHMTNLSYSGLSEEEIHNSINAESITTSPDRDGAVTLDEVRTYR